MRRSNKFFKWDQRNFKRVDQKDHPDPHTPFGHPSAAIVDVTSRATGESDWRAQAKAIASLFAQHNSKGESVFFASGPVKVDDGRYAGHWHSADHGFQVQ